jgi:F-type H+-transporting ATPase subunit b
MLNINATLIAIVINFIILVYILNYFLYKPILKILEDRRIYIGKTLSEADAKMSAAKAFMDEGKESINKANAAAKGIIDQTNSAAAKIKKDSQEKVKKEIEEIRARTKEEVKQYKLEAKKQFERDAAKISVLLAQKIIMKKIDQKTQKLLVSRFIEGIKI